MNIENANDHPFRVEIVKDSEFHANSHPFKVEVTGGGGGDVQDFTGATATTAGEHGLVPAPQAGDNTKFLKGDGTWDTAGGGGGAVELTSADYNYPTSNPTSVAVWLLEPGVYYADSGVTVRFNTIQTQNGGVLFTVAPISQNSVEGLYQFHSSGVLLLYRTSSTGSTINYGVEVLTSVNLTQSTGTSTTDVMSQNAVTSMVFADPRTKQTICVGNRALASGGNSVAVGSSAQANGMNRVAIGANANATVEYATAIGENSRATVAGEMNIGDIQGNGYNLSNYRLLTGLYDPQSDHDAATKGYVDTAVASAGANTISSIDWSDLWQ